MLKFVSITERYNIHNSSKKWVSLYYIDNNKALPKSFYTYGLCSYLNYIKPQADWFLHRDQNYTIRVANRVALEGVLSPLKERIRC